MYKLSRRPEASISPYLQRIWRFVAVYPEAKFDVSRRVSPAAASSASSALNALKEVGAGS